MAEFEGAVLISSEVSAYPRIDIIHPEFIVGRSKSSSFTIRNPEVSKMHCIFEKTDGIWTVCDKSSYGTYVNHKRLEKDEPSQIRDGDEISFGPGCYSKYVFYTKGIAVPSAKRMRLNEFINSEEQTLPNKRQGMKLKVKKHTAELERRHVLEGRRQLQDRQSGNMEQQNENLELEHQQAQDRTLSQQNLLQEKQLLEEKLKEMQNLLEEKDKGEQLLRKQLQKKEQRLQDLKQLQEQKDAQAKVMLEELKKEVAEKEELIKKEKLIKIQLAREIQRLQEEKLKVENNIQEELTKNGQSAQNLKQLKKELKKELKKVKTDLSNAEGKKHDLQNELEQITKAKEDAESRLKAKQDVLANLQELVEAELLCSICSERFVTEKQLLEEKLKEMQNLLEEKDKGEQLLRKQLQKKEQRLQDLKQLQEQKDAQAKVMLEELKKEVAEKEELIKKEKLIKIQLAREIQRLQEEKLKVENNIQEELTKNGQSAQNLKQLKKELKKELKKVKTDLSNAEGKKHDLQNELEQITKAKEDAESRLKAKQDVLANLQELVEAELLCSICSELFVTATTLNCAHTFCRSCIVEWQKREKTCPICRTEITSQNRSLVFDTFIDRMVENLSVEMKNRRQEVIEDRQGRRGHWARGCPYR